MAKENSILKLKGVLDGMSFYKNSEGHYVRAKGGIEKERIMNDANFVRTRENMNEFAEIASAGKLLRKSISTYMNRAKDMRTSNRIVTLMSQIKNLDMVSDRGHRKVGIGIATPEGKQVLAGFDFNKNAALGTLLNAPYSLDTANGTLSIVNFNPKEHVLQEEAATHISLGLACVSIDFEAFECEAVFCETTMVSLNSVPADLELGLDHVPTLEGVKLFFFLLEYWQEMNGKMYPLKNGSYNALNIIRVE